MFPEDMALGGLEDSIQDSHQLPIALVEVPLSSKREVETSTATKFEDPVKGKEICLFESYL